MEMWGLPETRIPIASPPEHTPPYLKEEADRLERRGPCQSEYIALRQCQAEKWPSIPHEPDLKRGRSPESLGPSKTQYKACMEQFLPYLECRDIKTNAEWYGDTFRRRLEKLAEQKQQVAEKAAKTK